MGQLPPNLFDLAIYIAESEPESVLDIGAGDGGLIDFIRGRYEKALYYALETDLDNISLIQSRAIPYAMEGLDMIDNYKNFDYAICHGDLSDSDLERIKKCATHVFWVLPEDSNKYEPISPTYPFPGIKKIK